MGNIATQLLQKVKETILLREENPKLYKNSFVNSSSFITATIKGNQEFVPINLLCKTNDSYQTLLDLYNVFGKPELNLELNGRLNTFCELNELVKSEELEIRYYVKPTPNGESNPFFDVQILEKLSNYAGTPYKASDAFLKDLGITFAEEVVDKTNTWVNSITIPSDYEIEHERYWQVAGRFKSFTWAKIYKKEHKDKKIFFSVGVNVQAKTLVIKLDVLRSGTHKLSNLDIRDFDYFAQENDLFITYNLEQFADLNLNALTFITNQFIANTKNIYEQAINFIWHESVDCSLFTNKLFKLSTNYTSNKPVLMDKIIEKDVARLIIEFEKQMLTYIHHKDLAENVKAVFDNGLNTIKSFETDGKPKTILYKASTGGTLAKLEMSREEIEFLGDNLHTFLYHIVEYNIENKSGKLIIRKGSPTKYAELRSINYEVKIG